MLSQSETERQSQILTARHDLDGRVAVVTGAAGGLGACYARELASRGASVVLVDLDEERLSGVAADMEDLGVPFSVNAVDLTAAPEVDALVARGLEKFGRLDVLINNAGGDPHPGASSDGSVDLTHWDLIFDINLKTTLLCCQAMCEPMKTRGYGRIVNVSSRAARSTGWFAEVAPEYGCAKIGVIALTRHFAKQLGPYGITVNCIAPSFTISGSALQGSWDRMSSEEKASMLKQTPLGRLPDPSELAKVVAFLSSEDSSYVTGVALDVNGGSFMS